ncbi:MAG: heme-binding protein [Pseudomonadota bacterium]
MKKILLAVASFALAVPAVAQVINTPPAMEDFKAPRPPHGHGVSTDLAIEAVQAALAACTSQGAKVTALMIDSEGVPIALVSADGGVLTERLVASKARVALKTKMTSTEAQARAKTDPAFLATLMADPYAGAPYQGGLPVMMGGEIAGAFAVGGASSGAQDESCAKAGLAKIQDRLH